MSDEVHICNMALGHLGNSKLIAALDERSTEARMCNLYYAQCRDEVLRDFPWPFATVVSTLALLSTSPTPEWAFSYAYPSEALRLVRAPYGSVRNPTVDTLTKYLVRRGASGGRVLYADQSVATIEYIAQVTDAGEFPPDFTAALSYALAARICPSVTSENRKETTLLMVQFYQAVVANAKANAANEESPDVEPDAGFIRARA